MYVQPLNYFVCPQTTSDREAHPSLKSLNEDFNRVEFIFLVLHRQAIACHTVGITLSILEQEFIYDTYMSHMESQ
jgi:hypothetical protein